MPTPDIEEMLSFLSQKGKSDASIQAAQDANTMVSSTLSRLNEEDLVATTAQFAAQKVVAAEDASIKMQTLAANALARTALGLDPEQANYRLSKLAAEREEAYREMKAAEAEVTKKKSYNILENPVEAILASFTMGTDIERNNHWDRLHTMATQEYDEIVRSGTATAQENNAMEATMTTAKAAAIQEQITQKSVLETNKIKAMGAGLNLETASRAANLSKDALSNASLALNARDAQIRIDLQREQMEATRADRQARLAAKAKADLVDETDAINYNAAAAAHGMPTLSAEIVVARAKRAGPDGDRTRELIGIGENIAINGGKRDGVLLGANVGEAAHILIMGDAKPKGTDAGTVNVITSMYNQVLRDAPQIAGIKDINERNQAVGQIITAAAKRELQSVGANAKFYAPVPAKALMDFIPDLKTDKFLNEVILPQSDRTSSAIDVRAAAVAAITSNPSRLEEIVGSMQMYFSAQRVYNNTMKGHVELGLPIQYDYKIEVPNGILGGLSTVDYSNDLEIRYDLMRATGRRSTMSGFTGGTK